MASLSSSAVRRLRPHIRRNSSSSLLRPSSSSPPADAIVVVNAASSLRRDAPYRVVAVKISNSHRNDDGGLDRSFALLTAAAAAAATATMVVAGGGDDRRTFDRNDDAAARCEAPTPMPPTRKTTINATPVVGAPFPLSPTYNKEVPGPAGIPSRAEQVRRLKLHGRGRGSRSGSSATNNEHHVPYYDVLVIGGGATGAGIAFDAVTRTLDDSGGSNDNHNNGNVRLKVACIERGDFASETSSRSTKLIWAGIKYLASATAGLVSWELLSNPLGTMDNFYREFTMVYNCHKERAYMLDKQCHLTNWIPIVCPFTEWHIWPPPFGHWLFGFFPLLAPVVFKFYDGLSGFTCPSSYVMGPARSRDKFPQLNEREIKYCAVFYEGQHNDSRTNLAIALSAAEKGADVANYVEMIDAIFDDDGGDGDGGRKIIGVKALDRITGETFDIYAKHIIFAGGPFTDALRQKEDGTSNPVEPAVMGASGSHIVLPGYYAPKDMGLLDYNTSDGRFLFFLPWQGSVIVGTTDKKGPAETLPYPPEDEIQWMLKECEKYLSKDLKVRRSDVLSAWRGWRPLASDPHAPPGGQISRDHIISTNPVSGVTFVAGGKWTTWREMAQDVLDKILGEGCTKCNTLDIVLHGGEGCTKSLNIQLIQKYGLTPDVAEHLVKTYGGRVWELLANAKPTGKQWPRYGHKLVSNYPYIEEEVRYACREYACTIEDVLSRRTRLAFLNSEAAMEVLPRVAEIMAEELGWSRRVKAAQIKSAMAYIKSYGGRIPVDNDLSVRLPTTSDAKDIFRDG